jgi:tetraprenyl-beta-curcumene synthase
MSAFGDPRLTARMSLALALANIRYWRTVAPIARTELERWEHHAKQIPDLTLRTIALENLREEGFNAQATATLATLAPAEHRRPAIEAIVGLQTIYDYLDSLLERPLPDPLGDGRRLYRAFVDAVTLDVEPNRDYYAQTPSSDDRGYLQKLTSTVRSALARLPNATAITGTAEHAAERCAEAQARAHAVPALGSEQLERWATVNTAGTGLQWREFLAGAVSSGFALHALIAAAADPHTEPEHAGAIDDVYLPMCALTTLLDGLVDYDQDMHHLGHPGYIRYYEDSHALTQALRRVIHRAATSARRAPNDAHHLMTLVGVAAYYLSATTASNERVRQATEPIRHELRPLITPTLALMSGWRQAKGRQGPQTTVPEPVRETVTATGASTDRPRRDRPRR